MGCQLLHTKVPDIPVAQTQKTATLCQWQPAKSHGKPRLEKAQKPRQESAACNPRYSIFMYSPVPLASRWTPSLVSSLARLDIPTTNHASQDQQRQSTPSVLTPTCHVWLGVARVGNPNRTNAQLISRSGHGLGSWRPLSPHSLHGKAGQRCVGWGKLLSLPIRSMSCPIPVRRRQACSSCIYTAGH